MWVAAAMRSSGQRAVALASSTEWAAATASSSMAELEPRAARALSPFAVAAAAAASASSSLSGSSATSSRSTFDLDAAHGLGLDGRPLCDGEPTSPRELIVIGAFFVLRDPPTHPCSRDRSGKVGGCEKAAAP